MNNTFDINRFVLLLRKDIQENWKKYLIRILTIYGALTLVTTWNAYLTYSELEQGFNRLEYLNRDLIVFTAFVFFIFGCISASMAMEPINSKTKRLVYLMNPSSSFEKYFSRWLIMTIGYMAVFFVLFWLSDATRVLICSIRFPDVDVQFIHFDKLIGNNDSDYNYVFHSISQFRFSIALFVFAQSLFILGSTFWPKNSLVKTFSAGIIIFITFLLVCWSVISLLFENGMDNFGNALQQRTFGVEDSTIVGYLTILCFIFALINWILAFFRFRESEVIKRL
jgi:hypothetical protein